MSSGDKLIEIPLHQLQVLRDCYKQNWPKHYAGFYVLNNYIRWSNTSSTDVKFYSLNGYWDDGTFIIIDRHQVFFNTLNHHRSQRLIRALNLLDYSKSYILSALPKSLKESVGEIFEKYKLDSHSLDSETIYYFMSKEVAINFDICQINGISLRPLNIDDYILVNNFWTWKPKGSEEIVKEQIKSNISLGAYTEDTNELIGWCIRLQQGGLGAFYIKNEYRRRGIGKLLLQKIAKILAKFGEDCYASVYCENIPSRKTFESSGFKEIDKFYWLAVGQDSSRI